MMGTKPGILRMLRGALVVLVVLQVGLPLLLWALRSRVLFFPDPAPAAAEGARWTGEGVACSVLEIRGPGGRRLEALDARPTGASGGAGAAGAAGAGPRTVVLWLHGNAGNASMRAGGLGEIVRATGARVVLLDYAGYGGSAGTPTPEGVVEDALAAYDALVASGVPEERLVLLGESLGGAVAAQVAAHRKPAGVALHATFLSLSSMARRVHPWMPLVALLARGTLDTGAALRATSCPILLAHGTADGIIPVEEGRALAAAVPSAEWVEIPGARHDDLPAGAGAGHLALLRDRLAAWTR